MSNSLKPCPFCGGLAYPEKTVCDYTIRCTLCSATTTTRNDNNCAIAKPSAADLWNTRHEAAKSADQPDGISFEEWVKWKFNGKCELDAACLLWMKVAWNGAGYNKRESGWGPTERQELAEECAKYFVGYSFSRHELAQCLGLLDVLISKNLIAKPSKNTQIEAGSE